MCEDIGIRLKRSRALAHARAVAVGHQHDRGAGLAGQLENLDDLLRLLRADGAVHHGEILRDHVHRAAIHRAGARHDAGVALKHRLLHEAAVVQQ